jgi:RNA polymerase sigma-70 factor (ECF subfamily)
MALAIQDERRQGSTPRDDARPPAGDDPKELDDAALLERARADPTGEAFRAFHERHAPALFRFLLAFTGDRPLAEDLLQEAFFRTYQHLESFDPARPAWPWLLSIARNAAVSALRSRKRGHVEVDPELAARGAGSVPGQVADDELAHAARGALSALQDEQRALLLQRHGLGLRLEVLATAWGCTERTIRNRLHAAADALLRALLLRAPRPGPAPNGPSGGRP